jgi:ABC-2 type transport system ATP-binding protein
MATLIARGLTKRFENTCAVDGVDLLMGEGEVKGLLGPNGAGKTTLLRILFGLVQPDAGSVELFGRKRDASQALVLDGVSGFVEDPSFYPYLSGRANLELLGALDDGGPAVAIDEVLAQVELSGRAGDRVGGYSSGMRQRLGIAAALLRAPRLLLLDEPTAGLDPAGVRFVGGLLRDLSETGVAVLLSSHQIAEIEDVCDSFAVLSRGRVVWDGSAAQMRAEAPAPSYRMTTSDDHRALELVADHRDVHAEWTPVGELAVTAQDDALDRFVLALARSGVAIRRLDVPVSPLESMFFALTGRPEDDPLAVSDPAYTVSARS